MKPVLPRDDWRLIKSRLRRTPGLKVGASDRRSIRAAQAYFERHFPAAAQHIRLLPISSMQWSSVVISRGQARVGFVDVEQANALELLLARAFWNERPLFSYLEFMVRAAETFFDDGDLPLAISVSERANERLQEYSRQTADGHIVPRPLSLDPELIGILRSNLILSFIIGHEIGHLLQMAGDEGVDGLFQWLSERFEEEQIDSSTQPARMRFVLPEILQKFNAGGQSFGFAVQGTKLAKTMTSTLHSQTREVQSDALGVLLATDVARILGLPADTLFPVLITLLENTELLMSLKRLLPQLPRGERQAVISDRSTGLVARQTMLLRLVIAIKEREIELPEEVLSYWSQLSDDVISKFVAMRDSGRLEQMGLRPSVVARGGLEVGLQKSLHPDQQEELRLKHGMVAGGLIIAQAHRGFPEKMYRIEESFDDDDDRFDGVMRGWGSAIRDLVEVTSTEERSREAIRLSEFAAKGRREALVEMLRSPRSQVFQREINEGWATGFEPYLRVSANPT